MFSVGNQYSKFDIYKVLEVPLENQKGAWDTGYRKYGGDIYIFANIGVAGRTGHNYDNHWEGSNLFWYAKTGTNIDQPLIKEMINSKRTIYIFSRTNNSDPFTYQGIATVKSFQNSTPVKIIWEFKRDDLINPERAWSLLLSNAQYYYDKREIYYSPKFYNKYQIIGIGSKKIKIKRLSTGQETEVKLTKEIFEKVINKFNASTGIVPKTDLYDTVAIEATIVWLLPMLDWDDDIQNIVFNSGENIGVKENNRIIINEAKNDIVFSTITRQIRLRRGQNKLRENLFYLYQGKCCISGCNIKEILHACHISPHSESGNNSTTNALLLRADLHDLFDSNLLGINPTSLAVKIKKVLNDTEYSIFENIKICQRIDGSSLDGPGLAERWQSFESK